MYKNLEAEMTRLGISRKEISKLLNVRYATVIWKLNGKSRFFYDEAIAIKKAFFPNSSVEYLFDTDQKTA